MTAPHADHIIAGYLARLKEALAALPRRRRDEIVAEIEEHISEARAGLAQETDTDVLDILDRVGHPSDIAEEARARFGVPKRDPGPLELAALLLIGLSGFIFPVLPVGWVLGVGLVWLSQCWTPREKRLGAYIPLVAALAVTVATALVGPFVHSAHTPIFLAAVLLPLASALYLMIRLGRRLPTLAWVGVALVAAIVIVSPVILLLPVHTYGFVGSTSPPGRPEYSLAATHCGGFYGTTRYGLGIAGTAQASVGVCFDGSQVRKTWGPDCYANSGALARIEVVKPCTVESLGNGSLRVNLQSTATANTTPLAWQSFGVGWVITPDGVVHQPPG